MTSKLVNLISHLFSQGSYTWRFGSRVVRLGPGWRWLWGLLATGWVSWQAVDVWIEWSSRYHEIFELYMSYIRIYIYVQLSKHALIQTFHGWQLCQKVVKTVRSDGTPSKAIPPLLNVHVYFAKACRCRVAIPQASKLAKTVASDGTPSKQPSSFRHVTSLDGRTYGFDENSFECHFEVHYFFTVWFMKFTIKLNSSVFLQAKFVLSCFIPVRFWPSHPPTAWLRMVVVNNMPVAVDLHWASLDACEAYWQPQFVCKKNQSNFSISFQWSSLIQLQTKRNEVWMCLPSSCGGRCWLHIFGYTVQQGADARVRFRWCSHKGYWHNPHYTSDTWLFEEFEGLHTTLRIKTKIASTFESGHVVSSCIGHVYMMMVWMYPNQ